MVGENGCKTSCNANFLKEMTACLSARIELETLESFIMLINAEHVKLQLEENVNDLISDSSGNSHDYDATMPDSLFPKKQLRWFFP